MATTMRQSLPRPAAGTSATFTALDEADGAGAGDEPDAEDAGGAA